MSEQQVVDYFTNLSSSVKKALLDRGMTQRDLAKIIHASPAQLSRALHSGMAPRDKEIRSEVRQILGIKETN